MQVSGILVRVMLFFLCFHAGNLPVGGAGLPGGEIRILWYNVENLFHPTDDSIPGDDEFTPGGVRHWTWKRYRDKLTALSRVIIAAGEGEPPELVGLGEIENDSVLADLADHPILRPYGYRTLHRDSPDHRGMDVGLLYRKERFRVLEWNVHGSPPGDRLRATRDMVHICGVADRSSGTREGSSGPRERSSGPRERSSGPRERSSGTREGSSGTREGSSGIRASGNSGGNGDSLDLFLVHLISRYSGTGATANYRMEQARLLVRLVDSVRLKRQHPLVVMAGDFNEEADGYSMQPLRQSLSCGDSIREILPEESGGSYKYRGVWERIDRFMVAGETGRYRMEGSILQLPVLLTSDEAYGGMKPRRTYVGYSYRGGVSDHLPVLLVIRRRSFLFRSGR